MDARPPLVVLIRIGLLVGIGGGIAKPHEGLDIRLGDVVVSQPDGATGGVVQYDLVKAVSGGERERKDFLNMPPRVLLHALAHLQAEHLDYADSHKNNRWQRYASAKAAAVGKELLSYVPASDLQKTRRAAELLQSS
ncbi:hypothetical protein N658DRAFT_562412 [Parathielavia hyrcaniae]|uniref:Uncharacterized protein n=1 Tax=Parathielavia hyrcaniae TaxID=113614 RepID=A0AAN6PR85_9PEZI|nr:hypothetical protein N658DRAFT_562412 [Parathielavia hyrcaniae]